MHPILLLLCLLFLSSCWTTRWDSSSCPTIDVKVADTQFSSTCRYKGPRFDPCPDDALLGDEGDPYQCRDRLLTDEACYGPLEGENYSDYLERVSYTMQAMQEESERLSEAMKTKEVTILHLGEQMAGLTEANHDLVAALSGKEEKLQEATKNTAFSRYEVEKGDTLQTISFRAYHTYRGWLNIYRFNMDRLPDGPNQIEVGQVLLIPENVDGRSLYL